MNMENQTSGSWSQKRVLITGAGGFMGSALARAVSALQPASLTLLCWGDDNRVRQLLNAEIVSLDLLERRAVQDFFEGHDCDVVFHLAGKVDQSTRPGIYAEQFRLHVEAAIHLTDALQGKSLQRFVHVGSNAECGIAPCPHPVSMQENPVSAYGASKLAATKLVLARAHSEGFPATVVRPFLVYGPGQNPASLLQSALNAARQGKEFAVTGGQQTRDFVSLEKFCADILAIAELTPETALGRVFNICTGVEISVREALLLIQQVYPQFQPVFASLPYRKCEIMRSAGEPFRGLTEAEARASLLAFIQSEAHA